MKSLWSTWILLWCCGVVAFGILLVTIAVPGIDGPARALLVMFSGDPATADIIDLPAVKFGIGIQGALSIGWGLTTLAFVQTPGIGAGQWQAITIAIFAWYVIDSAISVATGFWVNAVSNTVLFVAFLIPVIGSGVLKPA
jgi:hypothetical protein